MASPRVTVTELASRLRALYVVAVDRTDAPTVAAYAAAGSTTPIADQLRDISAQLLALADEVADLEDGSQPTPSPDGSQMPPLASLVDAAMTVWTLVEGELARDGVPDTTTSGVVLAEIVGGTLRQTNAKGDSWDYAPDEEYCWVEVSTGGGGSTPIPAPPVGDANVTVDFSKPTGRTLSKYLFGLSTGALSDNGWAAAGESSCKASLAKLKPTVIRVNANQNFPGAGSDISAMRGWINNYRDFCDPDVRLIVGVRDVAGCADFARAMREAGCEIRDWEAGNEMSDDASAYANFYNGVYDALKAVDPNYRISGTQGSWWNQINMNGWLAGIGDRMPGGLNYHSYPVESSEDTQAVYRKATSQTFRDCRNAVGARYASVPIWYAEYNMNGNPQPDGVWGDSRQGTYVGAMYVALQIPALFRSDDHIDYCCMWDGAYDGNYGCIGNHQHGGDPTRITLQGWYLGLGGQMLPGQEVEVSTGLPNVHCMATMNGAKFGAQFINTGGSAVALVPGFAGRAVRGPFSVVTMGKSNDQPVTVTPADLGALSLPGESIVLVSGGLA